MAMPRTTALLAIFTAGVVSYLFRWKRRQRDLPPGPPRLPLIGSLLSLPPKLEWDFFLNVSKRYDSDIIHYDALGMNMIILNSYEAAQELLDKRAQLVMLTEIIGFGFEFAIWPYNDQWRAARRVFAQYFNKPEIYQPREVRYSQRLLKQLLANPTKWYSHIQLLTASTTLDMSYGIKIESADDPMVKVVNEGMRLSSEIAGRGAHLVDLIPALRHIPEWFPGAEFQRIGAKARPIAAQMVNLPFQASVEMMKSGNYEPSYLTASLEDIENNNGSEEDITLTKNIAAMAFLAGSDTSKAVLVNFVAAMVTDPDIQRRAQEELDTVLQGRLPEHQDLDNLPYLTAIVLETYRIQPVLPLGLPHTSTMDDVYMGYRIPAGSLVMPNANAFLYNEEHYPEPQKFKPERFLKAGKLNPEVRNPMDIAFGFGRRICPGRHIAHSTIMLTTASILSTFDIVKQKDASGQPIEPVVTYHDDTIRQPIEFPCDFQPRSQQTAQLVLSLSEEL